MEWFESETHQSGEMLYFAGFEASVQPPSDEESRWFWRVDATPVVSEVPEIINCDFALNKEQAKKAAEECVQRQAAAIWKRRR